MSREDSEGQIHRPVARAGSHDDALVSDTEQRTVVFIDLAGFTTLTYAHGDDAAATLAEQFAAIAKLELGEGELLVKSIGDAVMLVAPSPAAGLALVGRVCARADTETAFPVLRAGLHHGPVVHRSGDWFGTTVNTAARIAARAGGSQVLGTPPIARAAQDEGVAVASLGSVQLRGLPEPVELFEVVPCPSLPRRAVDPVCRMAINQSNAVGRVRYDGQEFPFCSIPCVAAFSADPARYSNDLPGRTTES